MKLAIVCAAGSFTVGRMLNETDAFIILEEFVSMVHCNQSVLLDQSTPVHCQMVKTLRREDLLSSL